MATAMALFHRFYQTKSLSEFDVQVWTQLALRVVRVFELLFELLVSMPLIVCGDRSWP
jgi:hypothetical protein